MSKYVRNIVLVLALVLTQAFVAAQEVYNLKVGERNRDVNVRLLKEGLYLGQYDGLHCWAGVGEKDVKQVVLMDDNLVPQRSLVLPESSRYCDVLVGTMKDGRVALLLVDSADEGHTMLYRSVVDLATMMPAEGTQPMELTDSLPYGKGDHCYVWGAVSKNGEYVGRIVVVEYVALRQYSARATLYNANLETLWYKDYALASLEHLTVSDEGLLVTMGCENYYTDDGTRKNEKLETHVVFNIIGEHRAESYEVSLDGYPVRQLEMAGLVGHKLMGVGTIEASWSKSRHDNLTGGIVGLAFDVDSVSLTGITMRPFLNEDLNILFNEKTKKVQRFQEVDLASVSAVATTGYGAVLAVGRNWRADIVENNGEITRTHNRMGLNITAVDTNGNIRWIRNVRRYDIEKDDELMLTIGLMSNGDTVELLKKENTRTPVIYDVSRNVKPLIMGSKANTALYRISPEGNVSKVLIEQRKPYGLLRCIQRPEGGMLLVDYDGRSAVMKEIGRQ